MSLQSEIKDFKDTALAGLPQETIHVMDNATEELAESGIVNKALAKGDIIPPFSLPNIFNQVISAPDLLSRGPLVISFQRGSW